MYSLSLGYFPTKLNDNYWSTTGSPSFAVVRNPTEVICGEHKCAMFRCNLARLTKIIFGGSLVKPRMIRVESENKSAARICVVLQ